MLTDEQRAAIKRLISHIRTGRVIPIIGYDLLFYEYENFVPENDLLEALLKIHVKKANFDKDLHEAFKDARTGNELIDAYYHSLSFDQKMNFKVELSNTIEEQRLSLKVIPESLKKLVSIKFFKLFINATIINSVELALNAYRAEATEQERIKSSYQVFTNNVNAPEDLPDPAPSNFFMNLKLPTIYNLFGIHNSEGNEYIITDADYVELIFSLIKDDTRTRFQNLLSFLNGGYLLFLGCNFPDWFFRFFIRICVNDRLDVTNKVQLKSVIDNLNTLDQTRSVFIGQYGIQKIDVNSNVLIDEIYKSFYQEPGRPNLVQDRENNKVFISYCKKDAAAATSIAEQFVERFISHFIDYKELETGMSLTDTIRHEIDNACIVLALVSYNLQSCSDYFCLEWAYALHKEKKIWPVFIDFVDSTKIFLPCGDDKLSEIRDKILNTKNPLGIVLDAEKKIPEKQLNDLQRELFSCRIKGS